MSMEPSSDHAASAAFYRDGGRFVPTAHAAGPWAPGVLNGGPPAGLMAQEVERFLGDREMQVARLTIDLFRPVPSQPLTVRLDSPRKGLRLHAVNTSLFAEDVEVARTSALAIRRTDVTTSGTPVPPPPGPQGYTAGGFQRPGPDGRSQTSGNPGFATSVRAAWVSDIDADVPTVWMHIPFPLIAGEPTSPLAAAVALADFGSPLVNLQERARGLSSAPFINADIALYLHRQPVGDWFCAQMVRHAETEGVGIAETLWYDALGQYGTAMQVRMYNQRQPWGAGAPS